MKTTSVKRILWNTYLYDSKLSFKGISLGYVKAVGYFYWLTGSQLDQNNIWNPLKIDYAVCVEVDQDDNSCKRDEQEKPMCQLWWILFCLTIAV